MLANGTLLQNRYRIKRLLAQGGMGAVYEAEAVQLGIKVAVKETFFNENQQSLRAQFQREAATMARMRHPALPEVKDHFTEGAGQFLVMQFIPGDDLWTLLERRGGGFDFAQVMAWADTLLDALNYIHSQYPPVIHRDIKPQNVKLTPRGELFLIDFGLAKDATTPTRQGKSLHGYTLAYAPPEQMDRQGTDARSDLFSLGATLYHLLTGDFPVNAQVRKEAMGYAMPDPLRPAHQVNPQIPFVLSAVVARAMALDRERRYASAADMRQALRQSQQTIAEEQRRLEEERRQQEEVRRREQEAQRQRELEAERQRELEAQRLAEAARLAEEKRKQEEARQREQEAQRQREAQQRAEAARLAEEKRKQEEQQRLQEQARQREQEAQRQRQLEAQRQREQEAQRQRMLEEQRRGAEAAQVPAGQQPHPTKKELKTQPLTVVPALSRRTLITSASVAVVIAITLIGWLVSRNTDQPNQLAPDGKATATPTMPTAPSPTATPIAVPVPVDVLRYWQDFESGGFRFRFTAREDGYLYLVARDKAGVPFPLLTNRLGAQTNRLRAGHKFIFPALPANPLKLTEEKATFTLIFSSRQLTQPNFVLAAEARDLTNADKRALADWQSRAKTELAPVDFGGLIQASPSDKTPLAIEIVANRSASPPVSR